MSKQTWNLGSLSCQIFPRSQVGQPPSRNSVQFPLLKLLLYCHFFLSFWGPCNDQAPLTDNCFILQSGATYSVGTQPCLSGTFAQKAAVCGLWWTENPRRNIQLGACCESAKNSPELIIWERTRVKWIKIQENAAPCLCGSFSVPCPA